MLKAMWLETKGRFCGSTLEMPWAEFHGKLLGVTGLGDFLAMEVGADCVLEGFLVETKNWSPVGPGGNRGGNKALGRSLKHKVTVLELMAIRDALAAIDTRYAEWSLHEIQFALCEFDKFTRTGHSHLRPYFPEPPTDMEKELLRRITSLQRENFSQESKIKMLEAELKGANAQIERLEVGMGEATHVEDQANNVD